MKLNILDFDLHLTIEQVISWFTYDPEKPLLFNSVLFLGFFLVFYMVYICTRKHVYFRTVYVLLFSLFFYYLAGGLFFILLVFSCIANYLITMVMSRVESKSERKIYLVTSIVLNLFLLGYFKYTNFIINNINIVFNSSFALQNIILPIGISFFTFQAISYAVDLYKKDIDRAESFLDYSFYLCFFPQLVAGPIIRAKDFLPQVRKEVTLTQEKASVALFLIMSGLIKKAIISDYISLNFVDRVFDSPLSHTSFENLMATYGYTLQIYCDFSGYSDMAIGIALLMGFRLPKNFDSPYKSSSLSEFWRRWHISLSSWLRDYLYVPMGGNRRGKIRTYVNLFLTMLIGGLWHGAAWTYVIWGALHGLALVVERFFKRFVNLPRNYFFSFLRTLLVFHFVAFCWIFFRASSFDEASVIISQILNLEFNLYDWGVMIETYQNVFLLIAIGYLLHFFPQKIADKVKLGFQKMPFFGQALIVGFVFWLVYATASSDAQPFIYFQF